MYFRSHSVNIISGNIYIVLCCNIYGLNIFMAYKNIYCVKIYIWNIYIYIYIYIYICLYKIFMD